MDFGYNAEDTDGRVVVVHDSVGNKIACGVLSNALLSTVGDYPEMDSSAGSSPSGFVVVEQDTPDQCSQKESRLKLHYMLSGLETSSSGGLHVRLFSEENFFLNVYITHTHTHTDTRRNLVQHSCRCVGTLLRYFCGSMDNDLDFRLIGKWIRIFRS